MGCIGSWPTLDPHAFCPHIAASSLLPPIPPSPPLTSPHLLPAGLSSCISLKELVVSGNQLVNLKGVQRCQVRV